MRISNWQYIGHSTPAGLTKNTCVLKNRQTRGPLKCACLVRLKLIRRVSQNRQICVIRVRPSLFLFDFVYMPALIKSMNLVLCPDPSAATGEEAAQEVVTSIVEIRKFDTNPPGQIKAANEAIVIYNK